MQRTQGMHPRCAGARSWSAFGCACPEATDLYRFDPRIDEPQCVTSSRSPAAWSRRWATSSECDRSALRTDGVRPVEVVRATTFVRHALGEAVGPMAA